MTNIIEEVEKAFRNYEKRREAFEKEPTFRNDFWKDIAHDKYIAKLEKMED